ncbi:MAG: transcription-repair coupling factor [Calditrichaceae bacterium]
MKQLKNKIYTHPAFQNITDLLATGKKIHLDGVAGSFRAFIAGYIFEKLGKPLLYVAGDLDSAERMRDDVELLLGRERVAFLPAIGFEPYDHQEPNPSLVSMRMESMQKFIEHDKWIAVATIEGIIEKFPFPEMFLDNQLYLKTGNSLEFDSFLMKLQKIGFKRENLVEQVGDFSVRGGIIDLFAWNCDEPVRIELFGQEIESIRRFDVITQRSTETLTDMTILPNMFEGNHTAFLNDIIPDSALLFCEDSQRLTASVQDYFERARIEYDKNTLAGIDEEEPESLYLSPAKLSALLSRSQIIESDLIKSNETVNLDFKTRTHQDFSGSIKLFLEYLKKRSGNDNNSLIYIQSANQDQADRLSEILDEEHIAFNGKLDVGTLHNGFSIPDLNTEILTDHEIFQRFKRRKTYRRFKSGAYLRQLTSLNLYDYVVHIDYGIGQYLGMSTLEFGQVKKECIKIGYLEDDSLFVTVDRLNRVQKFSSEESGVPKLTKLGSGEWERTKKKTKESLKKVAAELIQIYAGRKAQPGFSFISDNHWQKELEASFKFEETEDQLKAIEEVKHDMENEQPMDRLLCGDVGFGKTEVALRAAFKAVMAGKQVAILVPTTILAFQHYETFRERIAEFPVKVEMLSRFKSLKEQKLILEELTAGKIDIVIGTHRLLSADIKFKDLGLLVIDEEQRFGVRHKEILKKYRLTVDVLSMTATPIPRTLHMALMGARDFSNIETPPRNRMPVHTEIIPWDDDKLYHIISREISRGGQVYFVHNRVETIEAVRNMLSQIVPQASIEVGHGQLPEKRLEKVMFDFMHQKFDILIASMIIENGLDIPNVNTIIINRADKFGLAQLYQLRGRVGRSDQQAYAYLVVPPMDKLTELARKRLRTIQDFTDLGSGYKVALRDLEIRGAGNLLGKQQSGFVQTVGFDLYCKILDEAVNDLKKGLNGDDQAEKLTGNHRKNTDPKIDVDFDLLIPADYIPNELERISIYHRLVNFSSVEQIEKLKDELRDRFGVFPAEVGHFLAAIEIKVLTGQIYAKRVIISKNNLKIFFSEEAQDDDEFYKHIIPGLMNQTIAGVRFLNQKDLGVELNLKSTDRNEQFTLAKKILQEII